MEAMGSRQGEDAVVEARKSFFPEVEIYTGSLGALWGSSLLAVGRSRGPPHVGLSQQDQE